MRQIKKGVELLEDVAGDGEAIERKKFYQIRLRCWLNKGDPVRWEEPWGLTDRSCLLENGEVLITDVRVDREFLIPGLFYGIEGMRIGGKRKIRVAPHLAYGEKGIDGILPENALLIFEVKFLEERYAS